jgi:hypothetical protein
MTAFQLDLFRPSTPPRQSTPCRVSSVNHVQARADIHFIPMVSVYPDRINLYSEVNWIPSRPGKYDQETGEKIKNVKFDHLLNSCRSAEGKVSEIARRKMTKAMDYLLLLANDKKATAQMTGRKFTFKVAFITLTLPSLQIHDDNEIKSKCLNQFLIEIRKKHNVKNYLWRAEKQKNRNLHFHILVDKFIPWSEIRDRWNRICNKLGYVDRYREEMKQFHAGGFQVRQELLKKWEYKAQVKAYKTGVATDWNSPNSTDVHSIRKVINIKSYIMKYMSKQPGTPEDPGNETTEEITQLGRIWGCNQELSKVQPLKLVVDNETSDAITALIQQTGCRSYSGDYFQVFFITIADIHKHGCDLLEQQFWVDLADQLGFDHQLKT